MHWNKCEFNGHHNSISSNVSTSDPCHAVLINLLMFLWCTISIIYLNDLFEWPEYFTILFLSLMTLMLCMTSSHIIMRYKPVTSHHYNLVRKRHHSKSSTNLQDSASLSIAGSIHEQTKNFQCGGNEVREEIKGGSRWFSEEWQVKELEMEGWWHDRVHNAWNVRVI